MHTFQILLIMATAAGLGLQAWFWLEGALIKQARKVWPRSRPWLPWIAIVGACVTLALTAGAINWARLEAPGLFIERRVFGAAIFICLTAISLFQARREQWGEEDGEAWPYWRVKQVYHLAAVPVLAGLYFFRPLPGDKVTVMMVEGLSHVLELPVAGTVFVSVVVAHLLIRAFMAFLGLALLRKIGA
ncbi:MAG: hypothetical protein JST30_06720 [Armatimonadetes bacterium]|nr:hypothetical protein [Armatimonadota bacterium]